tara:strand:+ start:175 stop:597 length:423 start_codon:yes stop_codon:yes gene_type:complete
VGEISAVDFNQIILEKLFWAHEIGIRAEIISEGMAVLRLPYADKMLRPGGTVAGPFMMALADVTMYAVVFSLLGEIELAVTTNLNVNFLNRPGPADLIAEGRMLKAGKRLVVCDVMLHSKGNKDPVAHVTGTYSIPPMPS